ncbi:MAG: RluA family pseudouridine synthase [Planctomycetota bacterium]|jgi:RluA family pseudouridine synthase
MKLTVEPGSAGARLDKFIASHVPGVSRAIVMKFVKEGGARVNGRPGRAGARLEAGDSVELHEWEEALARIREGRPEGQPEVKRARPARSDIPVLYEDEYMIAVDKPPGLVMHPGLGHEEEGLDRILRARFGANVRLVHRIDRDTSGVVVAARGHPNAARRITRDFAEGDVEKEYLAITAGVPRPREGSCDARLLDTKAQGERVRVDLRGRSARTDYETEEVRGDYALVRARPHTGRRHQIRVHLAHLGAPLAVDPIHGRRKRLRLSDIRPDLPRTWKDPLVLVRMPLHAAKLTLRHPATGEDLTIEAPMPADMAEFWRLLADRSDR